MASTLASVEQLRWIVERGVCTDAAFVQACKLAEESFESPVRALAKLGLVSEIRLAEALAERFELTALPSGPVEAAPELLASFNRGFLLSHWAVPIRRSESDTVIA